jgi:hypothetical protein
MQALSVSHCLVIFRHPALAEELQFGFNPFYSNEQFTCTLARI